MESYANDESSRGQTPYYQPAPAAPAFQTQFTSESMDNSPSMLTSTESDMPTPSETIGMDQTQSQSANVNNNNNSGAVVAQQALQVQQSTYPPTNNNTSMLDDIAKLPFSDFLRDVLYDQSLSQAQGLAVLDFCDDSNLDLNAMDFGLLDYWLHDDGQGFMPLPPTSDPALFGSGGVALGSGPGPSAAMTVTTTGGGVGQGAAAAAVTTAGGEERAAAGSDPVDISAMRSKLAQIWTESPWKWSPKGSDNVYAEQSHLPLSTTSISSSPSSPTMGSGTGTRPDPTTDKSNASPGKRQAHHDTKQSQKITHTKTHTLPPSGRDLILSMVLSVCKDNSSQFSRVASSFPSSASINHWIHIFLASHLCSVSSFIPCHLPLSPSSSTSSSKSSSSSKNPPTSNPVSTPTSTLPPSEPLWSLPTQPPEWHAITAAAGAILAPSPSPSPHPSSSSSSPSSSFTNSALRKFGFALQEAVRVSIPSRFEENNSNVTSLGLVQALVITQDLGVWSGNRRKMEIAECHLSVPVAMMRGRGKFTRGGYLPEIKVDDDKKDEGGGMGKDDGGKELEQKWKKWMEMEQWKRLAFHTFLREAQVSMTQLVGNPSISYAEMRMPLPGPKGCWFARTKEEWKARMLESSEEAVKQGVEGEQVPCLGDLLRDVTLLTKNWMRLDVQFAISIYLHGFWSLVWEYRQLASIERPLFGQPSSSSANFTAPGLFKDRPSTTTQQILISRLADLRMKLHQFQEMITTTPTLAKNTTPTEYLLLHLLLMHIHVSLEDLQLFSGKEGEEQAKRIYPVLQRWADSSEARQALWHAGQVLRWAKEFPRGHLREFWAAGVHLAALVVWGFGVLSAVNGKGRKEGSVSMGMGNKMNQGSYPGGTEYVGQQQQQHQHQNHYPQHQGYNSYGQQQPELHQQQPQTGMSSSMQQVMTPSTITTTPGATTSSSGATPSSVATPITTTTTTYPSTYNSYSSSQAQPQNQPQNQNQDTLVYLDAPQTPQIEHYIQHNTGRPALSHTSKDGGETPPAPVPVPVPLDDIAGCMQVCQTILKDNFGHGPGPDASSPLPAISENIIALLGKLGGVAGVVSR